MLDGRFLNNGLSLSTSKKPENKYIKTFPERPDVQLLNGRWGPYLVIDGNNFKLPKGTDAPSLSLQECLDIAADPKNASKGNRFKKKKVEKKPFKQAAAKKAAPKKAAKKTAVKTVAAPKKAAPKKIAAKKTAKKVAVKK